MCNCTRKRASYSAQNSSRDRGTVKVKLLGKESLKVTGDITGRVYVFSNNNNNMNWVDRRDIISMKKNKELQILH
jgi:hypothetical protein